MKKHKIVFVILLGCLIGFGGCGRIEKSEKEELSKELEEVKEELEEVKAELQEYKENYGDLNSNSRIQDQTADLVSIEEVTYNDREVHIKCKNISRIDLEDLAFNITEMDEDNTILRTQTGHCFSKLSPEQSAYINIGVSENTVSIRVEDYTYYNENGELIFGEFAIDQSIIRVR